MIGIVQATFSFDTFDELIGLATSRVPSGVAFGSDHNDAGWLVGAALLLEVDVVAADVELPDCVTVTVVCATVLVRVCV